MAATALDDAKRFLFLHPTVTGDDPVDLLKQLVTEQGVSRNHLSALRDELLKARARIEKAETDRQVLIDFLWKLVSDRRVSQGKVKEVLALLQKPE